MPKASTSSSRKPTPASSASTSKAKIKKSAPVEEPQEEPNGEGEEEAEAEDEDREEHADEDARGANDATVIAETQFEPGSTSGQQGKSTGTTSKGRKGSSGTTAKKVVAKGSTETGAKRKAEAEPEAAHYDDEDGEERVTPREKKLKLQLEAKEKALSEVTAQFKKLSELRHTRAEESETRLKSIADERQTASVNTIAQYKKEADTLRSENSKLQDAAYSSPRSKAAAAADQRVRDLEPQLAEATARVEELEKDAEERELFWQKRLEKEVKEREQQWKSETEKLSNDLETAQKDCAAEVAHSKSLQAKLKSLGPTSSSSSVPITSAAPPPSSSASAAKLAQVTEERELAIAKLQLNEDLTGFTVHSVRLTDEPSYTCSLTDCKGTDEKSLQFKMTFYEDGTVGYSPDIQPERDALLSHILPPEQQSYARFQAERCGEWFKKLYTSVNKRV